MSVPSPLDGLTEMVALTHTTPSSPMSDLGSIRGYRMIPHQTGVMRTMSDIPGFVPISGDMRPGNLGSKKATRPRRIHVLRDARTVACKYGFRNDPRTGLTVRSEINNQGTLPGYIRRLVFCGRKAQSPNKNRSTLLEYPGSFWAKLGLVRGIFPVTPRRSLIPV